MASFISICHCNEVVDPHLLLADDNLDDSNTLFFGGINKIMAFNLLQTKANSNKSRELVFRKQEKPYLQL